MKHNYTLQLRRTLSAILLLLVSTVSWAYDFEVDDIFYRFNDDGKSVYVTYGDRKYQGDIVIPSTVTYDGKTYKVTEVGRYAFPYCFSLTSVVIPDGVTSIGWSAFEGCESLTSIVIPKSVTSIESSAFSGCRSLISVVIPDGVTSIEDCVFSGCISLVSVVMPDGVTSIGSNAFSSCQRLTSISLPKGLTSIGSNAFGACPLTSVSLPEGLTSIGYGAFSACFYLTSIVIPSSVTNIGNFAFINCASLTSISLPAGLTSIGESAFYDCSSLTTVVCRAEEVPELGSSVFENVPRSEATLYVPSSAINAYKIAAQWRGFGTILPLEDYETAIDAPTQDNSPVTAPYYTTSGQRVTAPARGGIYIHKGRKVLY